MSCSLIYFYDSRESIMNLAKILTAVSVVALGGLISPASGAFISNGDLESLGPGTPTLFESWTNSAGATLASQAISGNNSARIALNTDGNALNQNANDPHETLKLFDLSFDFAVRDPGAPANARSMQLNMRTEPGLNVRQINMIVVRGSVPGMGSVRVFDGTAFQTALADVVHFSPNETDLEVNHVTVTGDFSAAPLYSITVNGTTSANLSFFQGGAPAPGTPLRQISFQSGNVAAGAWAVVDNIVLVPEPASLGLLGIGAFLVPRRLRPRTPVNT
jgi:hypothetical protein